MYGRCEADDSGLDFRNLRTFGALDLRSCALYTMEIGDGY